MALAASEPGKKSLDSEAGFVLRQENECRPVKENLTIAGDASEVKAAATGRTKAKK
jgi:hypothetical protein